MDHFVTLDRLPEGLEFPKDLTERIWIEPASKKLVFRGYMSKADFDRISQLSRDWAFRRKLEELFQISIDEDQSQARSGHRLFGMFRRRAVPS